MKVWGVWRCGFKVGRENGIEFSSVIVSDGDEDSDSVVLECESLNYGDGRG